MWKTNCENRLLICKGADICVDMLAGIRLDHRIEQRLHAGDNNGRYISDGHRIHSTYPKMNPMRIKRNLKKRGASLSC